MSLKITVDKSKCIGAASCVAVASGTFELDEQEIARVKDVNGDESSKQLLAAQSCPVGAITIIDQETGEQLWPKK
jgi:ferredoxin